MRKLIDGMQYRDMIASGAALLEQNRESVDALNVFPVPDGDTGTNMMQTISFAVREMTSKPSTSAADVADAVARGALRGARGNSGVILSQILRGFAKALNGHEEIDVPLLARMLQEGASTAYKAVMKPKEGTILTVIRVISEDITKAAQRTDDIEELFTEILRSGDAILRRTPEMLPVLKKAGVVDSGGTGLMVILRGMYASLTGEPIETHVDAEGVEGNLPGEFIDDHEALDEITFGYCTEFIVSHPNPDMKDTDVVRLRKRLERIGDCVLVISDLSVVKVHVHTNEPGKALQYALELGELDSIKIDNMFEEAREREAKRAAEAAAVEEEEAEEESKQKQFGIVAVALGEGFTDILNELNVDRIVDGGQTMNPSIQDIADAADATGAQTVFVLPNNTNIILAAEQAKALTERELIVLPTKSVPMGISAVIAFDPEADVDTNRDAMLAAAENVHTASVTYAIRDTSYEDRDIHQGDIMGMIDNKLEVVGENAESVALDCIVKMLKEESTMITIYYGEDVSKEKAESIQERLANEYPECDCDIEVQYGGQPLYYYLIGVE